jgi:hypothetical protein
MRFIGRCLAGGTAATGVIVSARAGVIIAGLLLGALVALLWVVVLAALYGGGERQESACKVLSLLLGRAGPVGPRLEGEANCDPPQDEPDQLTLRRAA